MVNFRNLQPQEIEVYYLLPAIRRELAKALKKKGSDQKTVAALLGVTPAAISQYLSGKRGKEIDLPPNFIKDLEQAAGTIKDSKSAYAAIQHLMRHAAECRVLCQIHYGMDKNLPKSCSLCFDQEGQEKASKGEKRCYGGRNDGS
jgi:predicted transcriptional regulator